jgi:hypothetical protein
MPVLSGKVRRMLLAGLTLIVTGLVIFVAFRGNQLGAPASAVLQGASVVLSVYGGVVFIRDGNDQHIRAAAKASARRVLVSYQTLGQLGAAISELRARLDIAREKDGFVNYDLVDIALEGLQNQTLIQIMSADAAIQDWRDLAPVEVDAEVNKMRQNRDKDG